MKSFNENIKANLHILRLLGDELIGTVPLAVFELVKNAYDADANKAVVKLKLSAETPSIVVTDDGVGMTLDQIRNGWLNIGTPSKRGKNRKRTALYKRYPLGEKGVGRLASFKLGDIVKIITRAENDHEYKFSINLNNLIEGEKDYINSEAEINKVAVKVERLDVPKSFKKNKTGTKIIISGLRNIEQWKRREIRSLHRLVTSLVNPFYEKADFDVDLQIPGKEKYIKDMMNFSDILNHAPYQFDFELSENGALSWEYLFTPPPNFKSLKEKQLSGEGSIPGNEKLALMPAREDRSSDRPGRPSKDTIFLDKDLLKEIGPFSGSFFIFDRRPNYLKALGQSKTIKDYLNLQAGVRIYRDNIRVYNYGEPGNDWLGLNATRVNSPGTKLATNAVIAALELELEKSCGLKEKTNREGFDEEECYGRFIRIIDSIVDFINRTRQSDRNMVDEAISGTSSQITASPDKFSNALADIKKISKKKGLLKELEPSLKKLEHEFKQVTNVALSSGAGLNLAVLFHEVERGVRDLTKDIEKESDIEELKTKAKNLSHMLEGLTSLFRKDKQERISISVLADELQLISSGRFNSHNIAFSCPLLNKEDGDFNIFGAFNFFLSALSNLIDNSIYWLQVKEDSQGKFNKAITVRTLPDWASEGPSIAVIDNGPGFTISPDDALSAFVSGRPGGMGLGLYYSQMVMEVAGGELMVVPADQLDLDIPHDGAAVVLRFPKLRK